MDALRYCLLVVNGLLAAVFVATLAVGGAYLPEILAGVSDEPEDVYAITTLILLSVLGASAASVDALNLSQPHKPFWPSEALFHTLNLVYLVPVGLLLLIDVLGGPDGDPATRSLLVVPGLIVLSTYLFVQRIRSSGRASDNS